jgi:hypothetical protein
MTSSPFVAVSGGAVAATAIPAVVSVGPRKLLPSSVGFDKVTISSLFSLDYEKLLCASAGLSQFLSCILVSSASVQVVISYEELIIFCFLVPKDSTPRSFYPIFL